MLKYDILCYIMQACLLKVHCEPQYGVDVKRRNNGYINEDYFLFLKMFYSYFGTEHQEQRYNEEFINRENMCHKWWVTLVWFCSMKIFSQIWHGMLSWNPGLRIKSWPWVWILKAGEDLWCYADCKSVLTSVWCGFMISTSEGEGIKVWYTVVYYVMVCSKSSLWSTVWYRCERRNNGCISEDDLFFWKWTITG